jgi:hypothetical protein
MSGIYQHQLGWYLIDVSHLLWRGHDKNLLTYRWMFPTTEAPRFQRGTSILLGVASAQAVFAIINSAYLYSQNKRKERLLAKREQSGGAGSLYEGVGDRSLGFKYIT